MDINTTTSSVWYFKIEPKIGRLESDNWNFGPETWVSVSGDGRFVLIGSDDDEVRLYDYDSEEDTCGIMILERMLTVSRSLKMGIIL